MADRVQRAVSDQGVLAAFLLDLFRGGTQYQNELRLITEAGKEEIVPLEDVDQVR